mmetsp:Transcript_86137/g.223875  ORF Transcript_86137/g.223875 Transcript_86137/m.223875 type:complete len:1894 (+) Transcript_86137:58-5739(+)
MAECDTGQLIKGSAATDPFKVVVVEDDGGSVVTVRCHGKESVTCRRSLFVLPIDSVPRKAILALVQWKWFDRFILLCIVINSILLAIQQHRADPDNLANQICANVDKILTWVFIMECVLKIIGLGFLIDRSTYLRDPWNILDFVVVVSAVVEMIPAIPMSSLGFLRLFRVLRPLRSLNAIPEMKALVNTTISAVPRLGNVAALGVFIGLVFAIIGVTLMPGVFYHQCRETLQPKLVDGCWAWNFSADAAGLCGGEYDCSDVGGYCFGHEFEQGDLKPSFPDGIKGPAEGGPYPWCEGSAPFKLNPETDFVHFDHLGGAFLLIFQCMTMEGWTDLMYYVQDATNLYLAWVYFVLLIIVASFFLLNVALAVVDEARDDFEAEEEEANGTEEEEKKQQPEDVDEDEEDAPLWIDCTPVRKCRDLTRNEIFANIITLVIAGNVVTMMLDTYPPIIIIQKPKDWIARVFLLIFIFEMVVELIARGPKGYVKNLSTCFDGFVVIVSIIEEVIYMSGGQAGGLKALRTLRLFRVLNKFASRSPALRILLASMVETAKALRYWLVLFMLVLYIFTLMWIHFFANAYHFKDPDALDEVDAWPASASADDDSPIPWCPVEANEMSSVRQNKMHHHQDCIPRAHFDNFGWGFVTIFQVMTGENWNTIMYAGMRAGGWGFGFFYVILLLFGQILFLSLFLSMLLSKFEDFKSDMEEAHQEQKAQQLARAASRTNFSSNGSKDNLEVMDADKNQVRSVDDAGEADWDERMATDEALPGQLPESRSSGGAGKGRSRATKEAKWQMHDCEEAAPAEIPSTKPYPHDYSWFILHKSNLLRRGANMFLEFKVGGSKKPQEDKTALKTKPCQDREDEDGQRESEQTGSIGGILVFDNFILVCILVSTLCMMLDDPLADPEAMYVQIVRGANNVFVGIFIFEMLVKLVAFPLFWGEGAYLHDAWNWLDGIVVLVSIITTIFPKGPSFLKTLRILRAFRPLRVIKRMETLKMVVETIFKSMQELGVLLIVFLIFLLIFALLFMMYLSGYLYHCENTDVVFLKDVNGGEVDVSLVDFTLPLCLGSSILDSSNSRGSQALGKWTNNAWTTSGFTCPTDRPNQWQRASADTPICVARCDPFFNEEDEDELSRVSSQYTTICPRKYKIPEELPSRCDGWDDPSRTVGASEQVGLDFISAMQAWYTVPCAGSTPDSSANGMEPPMAAQSCRNAFCGEISNDRKESCKAECENPHPFFCATTCEKGKENTGECKSCLEECQAACECSDFCTPLMKDAALCHEQGSSWGHVLSQNFNNVWNSMLTLTEISTTEGWVDVMYAACDATGPYLQPVRDTNHPLWMILFSFWIFLSFMFLMNLGVGVIVEKFMEMRKQGRAVLLSPAQEQWVKCRTVLHKHGAFVFTVTHLDLLDPQRRKIYNFVTHPVFDTTIMTCIVTNTLLMAIEVFPELETPSTQPWRDFKEGINLVFAFVFLIEAVFKLLAFRGNYWKDKWNCFDFGCVFATIVGLILQYSNSGINISSLASVIRIFRIARLFRLLKFKPLRPMNKLFSSLAVSLVKLANVGVVACLFLILFSILGVNLFSTVSQEEDTLNGHGNFKNFWTAFMTLFRASTGEAWNEIMHDLHKDEVDFFREGRWCTPADLFDWQDSYSVLKDKCLIDKPNACVTTFWGWNPLPWAYWILYTLFIGLVIMNIVVAVILEGYDESKASDEGAIIDTCKTLWERKYDPDHKMIIPTEKAVRFILEAIKELQADGLVGGEPIIVSTLEATSPNWQLAKIPMRLARAFDMSFMVREVGFFDAVRQVLRFVAVVEHEEESTAIVRELDSCDDMPGKHLKQLKTLEEKNCVARRASGDMMTSHLAAIKLQKVWKRQKSLKIGEVKDNQPSGTSEAETVVSPRIAG